MEHKKFKILMVFWKNNEKRKFYQDLKCSQISKNLFCFANDFLDLKHRRFKISVKVKLNISSTSFSKGSKCPEILP